MRYSTSHRAVLDSVAQVNQDRQLYASLEGDLINRPAFFEKVLGGVHMSPAMNADRHSAAVQGSAAIRANSAWIRELRPLPADSPEKELWAPG
jgi:hypothetical protein